MHATCHVAHKLWYVHQPFDWLFIPQYKVLRPIAAGALQAQEAESLCAHAGVGNGARVAAVVGTKCRGTIAGFALLSYPLEVRQVRHWSFAMR